MDGNRGRKVREWLKEVNPRSDWEDFSSYWDSSAASAEDNAPADSPCAPSDDAASVSGMTSISNSTSRVQHSFISSSEDTCLITDASTVISDFEPYALSEWPDEVEISEDETDQQLELDSFDRKKVYSIGNLDNEVRLMRKCFISEEEKAKLPEVLCPYCKLDGKEVWVKKTRLPLHMVKCMKKFAIKYDKDLAICEYFFHHRYDPSDLNEVKKHKVECRKLAFGL